MSHLESSLEALFRLKVRQVLGGRIHKMASEKGMPDRLVLLPAGRLYLVELKTETGRLEPLQRVWHERAAELGTTVVVLRGRAEILAWITARAAEWDPRERKASTPAPKPPNPKPRRTRAATERTT